MRAILHYCSAGIIAAVLFAPPAIAGNPSTVEPAAANRPRALSRFLATPPEIVGEMLELAEVTSTDVVWDLGSGDGRIVIAAAARFGARGVGVEIDSELVEQSRSAAREAGVHERVRFIEQDALSVGEQLAQVTVVTLYLPAEFIEKLRPVLERHLRPGTRVVAHEFGVDGWVAVKHLGVLDHQRKRRDLFLYRIGEHEPPSSLDLLRTLFEEGSCVKTLAAADAVLAGRPSEEEIAETLFIQGVCHQRAKQPAEALVSLKSLLALAPDSPHAAEAAYIAALIHRKRHEHAVARATLEDLIRRFPDSAEAVRARRLLAPD